MRKLRLPGSGHTATWTAAIWLFHHTVLFRHLPVTHLHCTAAEPSSEPASPFWWSWWWDMSEFSKLPVTWNRRRHLCTMATVAADEAKAQIQAGIWWWLICFLGHIGGCQSWIWAAKSLSLTYSPGYPQECHLNLLPFCPFVRSSQLLQCLLCQFSNFGEPSL